MVCLAVSGCKEEPEKMVIDYETTPVQTVVGMDARQYSFADIKMEMRTHTMERYSYEKDSVSITKELYKDGFEVYVYNEDGLLESQLIAQEAEHVIAKKNEDWKAYGNVNILNHIKGERIITDTVFWDKPNEQIYTHCYVIMTSPKGRLQGYGMRSDQRVNESKILRPFDSYGVVVSDSTKFYIDTVNFVGPFPK
ncbi:MAG: LPS export ABC transporter periplasmic protein LptC [Bacteroidales bacterium]|nr:LPS export ABC transporter periplasmic protein LptC [Candidatus Equibacterium intestinale]